MKQVKQVDHSLPGHWDYLPFEMRREVLRKLPLRDLAPAMGTCQEFREDFRTRERRAEAPHKGGRGDLWEGGGVTLCQIGTRQHMLLKPLVQNSDGCEVPPGHRCSRKTQACAWRRGEQLVGRWLRGRFCKALPLPGDTHVDDTRRRGKKARDKDDDLRNIRNPHGGLNQVRHR